jgi:hypothetical protein
MGAVEDGGDARVHRSGRIVIEIQQGGVTLVF